MYQYARGYELRQRLQTTTGSSTATNPVPDGPRQTVGGVAVLSAFPTAFVVALSAPVLAMVVLSLTVGMVFGGGYLRRDVSTGSVDRALGPVAQDTKPPD